MPGSRFEGDIQRDLNPATSLGNVDAAQSGSIGGRLISTPKAFRQSARGSAFACGVDDLEPATGAFSGWFKTTQFFTSPDNASLTAQGFPGTTIGGKVVRFGDYVYADGIAGGLAKVYRALAPSLGGSPVTWSGALLSSSGTSNIGPCLNKSTWPSNNFLYFGEYGDPSGGPSIWRTSDGATWDKVLGPVSGLRHFHCVAPDPYKPGHVYASAGDGQSKVLYRSTDYGSTWTLINTNNDLQAVQISFTPDWVFLAGDQQHCTVWVLNRDSLASFIASSNFHALVPVPGGTGARGPFTDGALTSGSATFTSGTAAFTSDDVGKQIRLDNNSIFQISGDGGIYIAGFTNGTTVTLNKNAGGNASSIKFWVDGDSFYRSAFYGAVDPATGIYYALANDNSGGGNRYGLFALVNIGEDLSLLESFGAPTTGEVFIRNGIVWAHQSKHILLAK